MSFIFHQFVILYENDKKISVIQRFSMKINALSFAGHCLISKMSVMIKKFTMVNIVIS